MEQPHSWEGGAEKPHSREGGVEQSHSREGRRGTVSFPGGEAWNSLIPGRGGVEQSHSREGRRGTVSFPRGRRGTVSFPGGEAWNSLIPGMEVEQPGNKAGKAVHVPWLVSWKLVPPHHCTLTVWMRTRKRGKMVNIENGCLDECNHYSCFSFMQCCYCCGR